METAAPAPQTGADLERSLRGLFAGRDTVAAGRFQVINLDRFREKLGDGWERYKDRIKKIAAQVIAKHLSPADLHVACRDLGFMVLFSKISPQEAELKARLISTEITRRVLGDNQAETENLMRSAVVALSREAMLSSHDIVGTVDMLLAESDLQARTSAATAGAGPAGPNAAAPVPPVDYRMEPEPLPSPRSAYRLVWDVHRKVLSTYACVVECGLAPSGNAMPARDDDANRLSELDLFALERVGRDLSALRRSGKRALISSPIHFETLANKRHRKRFFKILEGFPAPMTRDLLFGLRGFSDGVPSGRLLELTAPVARMCRSLILQVDLDHRSFRSLRETGIRVVNVEFAGQNDNEAGVIEAMNDFAQRASQEDMILVGGGLTSRSMVFGALGAGFAYVEGSAIHQHVASPEQVIRFNIVDLFAQYAGSAATSPQAG